MNISSSGPSEADQSRLWLRAWHKLHSGHETKVTREDIDRVIAVLPPRLPDEAPIDWLRRAQRPVVADFLRMAASSDALLPLPERPIETERFRFGIVSDNGVLALTLQALGMAIDEFAGVELELAEAETGRTFARFALDVKGKGQARVPDNADNRRMLMHLQLRRV